MTRILILAFAVFLSLPALAAAPIDQAGADALKPRVAESLDGFAASLQQAGITVHQTGNLLVEPAGAYYAITTPNITLQMPGNVTRTVGMVAINAIPTADPDIFKVAVALPTPMMDTNEKGETIGSLAIGQQAMNGLWHMKALTFVEVNGSYKNIRIVNSAQGTETQIPGMTATVKLTQSGKLWSGPADVMLTNYSHRDKKLRYQIGGLHIQSQLDGLDMTARKNLDTKMKSQAVALKAILADFATHVASAVDTTITANDLKYQRTWDDGAVKSGGLQSAVLRVALKDLRAASASAAFNLALTNLTSDDASLARYMTSKALVTGAADKLPVAELILADGNNDAIRAALSKAGSTLDITTLNVDAPAFGIDGNGKAAATQPNPSGKMHIAVRGLEDLVTFLNSSSGPQALGMKQVPPMLLAGLTMAQLMGQPGTDAQGRPTKVFDLGYTEAGSLTLNGADLGGAATGGLTEGMQRMKNLGVKIPGLTPAKPH